MGFPARRQTDCHLGFLYTNVAEALFDFFSLDLMLHFREERPNPNWAIVPGTDGGRAKQVFAAAKIIYAAKTTGEGASGRALSSGEVWRGLRRRRPS